MTSEDVIHYLFLLGGMITLYALIAGGVDAGWTFYTPFSTFYSNTHVIAAIVGVLVAGFSSILTGLNIIVTTHALRAPGMSWFRLPLFIWAHYAVLSSGGAVVLALGYVLPLQSRFSSTSIS